MEPYYRNEEFGVTLYCGDALAVLPHVPKQSVDAVVSDPPYPEIDREYGRLTEDEWHFLMRRVVSHTRRVLKPQGSAVFILQPNSERVGRMRAWLWEFMAWTAREWNQVQDAWWWNTTALPTVHTRREHGLMRPSLKASVWLGAPDCYRNQNEVLWTQADANKNKDREARTLRYSPSSIAMRDGRLYATADERGGSTPFNVVPVSNAGDRSSGGFGHSASTPMPLAEWWVRYISPPGGTVADWFNGSGTMAVAAIQNERRFIGCEQSEKYCAIAVDRIEKAIAERSKPRQLEIAV